MRNALFLNTGTERFMEGAFLTGLANSDWTWTVKLSGLDGDLDLVVCHLEEPVGIYRNDSQRGKRLLIRLQGAVHEENEHDDFAQQLLLPNRMSRLGPGQAWGDLDLFVGGRQVPGDYPAPAQSVLLVNEGGRFQRGDFTLNGLVTSARWSDVDRDGWIDLLVALAWGPVRVFHNQNGQLVDVTESAGLAEFTGWWNGLAGGDFDGDGDLDYVATNFGLNTKYHASPGHPALLYYGDFGTPGSKQIVEAEFEDDILYPGRGRSCSSNAMPHLRESFTTFRDFATLRPPSWWKFTPGKNSRAQ